MPRGQPSVEPLRILTGETASGKSAVAVCLAVSTDAEIISVDSIKVYRKLDIGAAKPPPSLRKSVRFHMMDVVGPDETFSLARYLAAALPKAEEVVAHGKCVLFVGGTPLYLRGLVYGIFDGPGADPEVRAELNAIARRYSGTQLKLCPHPLHDELRELDPVTAERLHPNDLTRIVRALEVVRKTGRPISSYQSQYRSGRPAVTYRMIALRRSEEDLRNRIRRRTERMFADGLISEVRAVLEHGRLCRSARKAIGYQEALACLEGRCSLEEAIAQVKRRTWRLARKQRTWLRSFPDLKWVDVASDEQPPETAARVKELLFGWEPMN